MRLPRWYRNGLVVWLCTGLPLLLVALLLGDDPRLMLQLPAARDAPTWLFFLFVFGFPLVALPFAAWQRRLVAGKEP